MAAMLNFEVIFDKFKIYRIHSKLKLTITILIDRKIKKIFSIRLDFTRSGRSFAY